MDLSRWSIFNKSLCRLYDDVREGHNPLVDAWDKKKYAELVSPDSIAFGFFETLNGLWVNGGMYSRSILIRND